jgi:hypothetical protein
MEPVITILDKNSLGTLVLDSIKNDCFYTTLDCLNSFSRPNLSYDKEARQKIRANIKILATNKKIIVTQKENKIRKQIKEYIKGFYPVLTNYSLSESEGHISASDKLKEDVSFLLDCVLCGLANEQKKVIIFTRDSGIIELFDKFSNGLEKIKMLRNRVEENDLFFAPTQKLNVSIISDINKLVYLSIL